MNPMWGRAGAECAVLDAIQRHRVKTRTWATADQIIPGMPRRFREKAPSAIAQLLERGRLRSSFINPKCLIDVVAQREFPLRRPA